MLDYGFPRAERLFNIRWGLTRMVNSCMSPLRLTRECEPSCERCSLLELALPSVS